MNSKVELGFQPANSPDLNVLESVFSMQIKDFNINKKHIKELTKTVGTSFDHHPGPNLTILNHTKNMKCSMLTYTAVGLAK